MFFDDSKRAVTTILSRRKASGEKIMENVPMKAEVVKKEDGSIDGRHIAAQEMMGAFHEKSAQKLMDAMSSFIDIHSHQDSGSVDG